MTISVVAFVGPRRAGKDSLGAMLGALVPSTHVRLADPLKAGVAAMFGVPRADLESSAKDVPRAFPGGAVLTPRQVMQSLGTEFAMGLMGERVWAHQCVERIRRIRDGSVAVITDVRFPHEVEVLREAFGSGLLVVRVTRPGSAWGTAADRHVSETAHAQISPDMSFTNGGSLQDLSWRAYVLACRVRSEKLTL